MAIDARIPLMGRGIDLAGAQQAAQTTQSNQMAIQGQQRQNKIRELVMGTPEQEADYLKAQRAQQSQVSQMNLSQGQMQALQQAAQLTATLDDPEAVQAVLGTVRGLAEGNAGIQSIVDSGLETLQQGGIDAYRQAIAPMLPQQEAAADTRPAAVREFEYFDGLPADKKAAYMNVKRNGFKEVMRPDGGLAMFNPTTGQQVDIATGDEVRNAAGALNESEAAGTSRGSNEENRAQDIINQGQRAADTMAIYARGIDLLQKVETGGINAIELGLKRRLGLENADEGELAAGLGKAVLSQLRDTFGAAFTAKEGESLARIEANLGKSTETNLRLLRQAQAIAKRSANRAIRLAEDRGDFETAQLIEDSMNFDIGAEVAPNQSNQSAPQVGGFRIISVE